MRKGRHKEWGTSTSTTGAIYELRVSVDLAIKGWDVFRALSPSCSCDLVAIKGKKIIRIEVKRGYETVDYEIIPSSPVDKSKFDHLALYIDEDIHYVPPLD